MVGGIKEFLGRIKEFGGTRLAAASPLEPPLGGVVKGRYREFTWSVPGCVLDTLLVLGSRFEGVLEEEHSTTVGQINHMDKRRRDRRARVPPQRTARAVAAHGRWRMEGDRAGRAAAYESRRRQARSG